jgi:hypothetical protein
MADLTDLLLTQSEAKLQRLRTGILSEIERLGLELRVVDEVLTRKRGAKATVAAPKPSHTNGRANELSRGELYAFVVEFGKPAKPTPLAQFISTKGVPRRPEAVRNGLMRLVKDKKLVRLRDGSYAVPGKNGDGAKSEAGSPEGAGASFEASGLQP